MRRSLLLFRLAVACACLAVLASCASIGRPSATFGVDCTVPEAMVLIDDVLVGRAADWAPPGKLIRPGFHRIEIRHPSYFSHYAEVQLAEGAGTVVKAELRPLLD